MLISATDFAVACFNLEAFLPWLGLKIIILYRGTQIFSLTPGKTKILIRTNVLKGFYK